MNVFPDEDEGEEDEDVSAVSCLPDVIYIFIGLNYIKYCFQIWIINLVSCDY